MAKVWVLDTETKGTGANMVPLERTLKHGAAAVPGFRFRKPETTPASKPEAKAPREFKVIDIMTREVVAEYADARATVTALEQVRSVMDVTIYVWEPKRERWRMLTFAEKRALWDYRGAGAGEGAAAAELTASA